MPFMYRPLSSAALAAVLVATSLAAAETTPVAAPTPPAADRATDPDRPDASAPTPAQPASDRWRLRERLPLATAVVGAALLGTGLGFAISAQGDRGAVHDAMDAAGDGPVTGLSQAEAFELRDSANKKSTAGIVLGSIGAAVVAGSLAWWFMERSRRAERANAQVWIAPAHNGLAVGGTF